MPTVNLPEVRAAGSVAGRGLSASATLIRDTHLAIARRAFTLSGPGARPAHVAHDLISRTVYGTVAGGLRIAGYAAGAVAARKIASPRGNVVVGALNGAWGDRFVEWSNPLALPMSLRHDGRDVDVDRAALTKVFPDATGDVAVFVHGLCETDASWRLGARDHYGDARSTHGERLHAACGLTPIYVRYNTGRHVCDNGDDLAELIERVVGEWPVPITRLTLIGHSMGGLVIRAACHRAVADERSWLPLVERIVYLGSPHLGAPLEVAVTRVGGVLHKVPETRALADALATRSVGIKDLHDGDIRPLLDTATHYYIGATIGRRNDTVAARVIGDALVPWASASGNGKRRRLALDVNRGRHLGGLNHFDLLNHPRVYAVLEEWLAE